MILLGIPLPVVAVLGHVAIAVFYVVPFRSFRSHATSQPPET